MEQIKPKDLKSILHSKRANIFYLEHSRILVKGGRVEYVTEQGKKSLYWNIPIANTTTVLLGTGTSVTQAAMREFAKAGVMVGFCGDGGLPLYSATEFDIETVWFSPQSEYRPVEYLQKWMKIWLDENSRQRAAKQLQIKRAEFLVSQWSSNKRFKESGFAFSKSEISSLSDVFCDDVKKSSDASSLLLAEARFTKRLFRLVADKVEYGDFVRCKNGLGTDVANRYLDHGNYLAYGLGATATWVLGLPHGLSVLHGKTRRGGLVFDAADLVKDALVLPQAFISAMQGDDQRGFRQSCIEQFASQEALDFIFDSLKEIVNSGDHS